MSTGAPKKLFLTGQSVQVSNRPGVDAEGQTVVRQYGMQAQAQARNPGPMGPEGSVLGSIPATVQYSAQAGQMAQAARTACAACVAEGTLVFADGRLLPIEQAVQQNVGSTFLDNEWKPVVARVHTGIKDVVEVTTTHGAKFRVTPDHRIMTERGWVAAADLRSAFRPGGINDNRDVLDAPMRFEMAKTDAISRDDAFMVGALTGDGWIARRHGEVIGAGFCYSEDMKETWAPLLAYAAERLGSVEQPRIDDRPARGLASGSETQRMRLITWRNKNAQALGRWLDKKHAPAELWRSTPEAIGGYLCGLFSTDGSIGLNPRPTVHFYQTSKSLIDEVQILLRSLGIYSTVSVQLRAPKFKDLYNLTVARHESLERFIELVGFFDEYRQRPLEDAVTARRGKGKKSFERVRSVEMVGTANVYDLSVPGPDAFLANGVRVHNCKHFDVKAWREFLVKATGPASTPEWRETIRTMEARIAMAGYGYAADNDHNEDGVQKTLWNHGICRVLSDWVESVAGRDPNWWPVVPWREASCPTVCRAGAGKPQLAVVTAQQPYGLFKPRDLDAQKAGAARYDAVMQTAQGKK